MSKNIKDITKELMGSSLNSFHIKTGLKQLENNSGAQTRVLKGIYSQVDNGYIEKTEQSRIIHLEGSDNGPVEIKSVEGNTLINMLVDGEVEKDIGVSHATKAKYKYRYDLKDSTDYIITFEISGIDDSDFQHLRYSITEGYDSVNRPVKNGKNSITINSHNIYTGKLKAFWVYFTNAHTPTSVNPKIKNITIIERPTGEIPTEHINGIKSSFEENITPEGKYKVDITVRSGNIFDNNYLSDKSNIITRGDYDIIKLPYELKPNAQYTLSVDKIKPPLVGGWTVLNITPYSKGLSWIELNNMKLVDFFNINNKNNNHEGVPRPVAKTFTTPTDGEVAFLCYDEDKTWFTDCLVNARLNIGASDAGYTPYKQNKITILLQEPLRGLPQTKDRLCIIDNKLMVERNITRILVDNSLEVISHAFDGTLTNRFYLKVPQYKLKTNDGRIDCICNIIPASQGSEDKVHIRADGATPHANLSFWLDKQTFPDPATAKRWLVENNAEIIAQLSEPVYEEVVNEYGVPVILEGYENGTVYIDSNIPPTTTVGYVPKNQTLKTLKDVNSANADLALDINSNVLPYIMEIDSMILEKELIQNYKMKMEALDMTSMQERTFNMLARLIKGKTLTKEEAKDRVLLYETANRITSKQALELMVIIEETYA